MISRRRRRGVGGGGRRQRLRVVPAPPRKLLHAFVSCATSYARRRRRHTRKGTPIDHYSSPSVRLSADTNNAGATRNVLIENDYEVTYGTYFKIVRMKCGFHHAVNNPSRCTKITYVLRKRGTAIPTTDPHTNESIETTNEDGVRTRHFEIPATSIAVGGTFVLAYLEMLDVNTDILKLIDSRYMHSPCMQLAVHTVHCRPATTVPDELNRYFVVGEMRRVERI